MPQSATKTATNATKASLYQHQHYLLWRTLLTQLKPLQLSTQCNVNHLKLYLSLIKLAAETLSGSLIHASTLLWRTLLTTMKTESTKTQISGMSTSNRASINIWGQKRCLRTTRKTTSMILMREK